MPVNADLFELVRVMDRKEKSYFRRYFRLNSAGKDGAMLRLFEKMVLYCRKYEQYDEESLKKLLDFRTTKHLAVTKNNLYRLILKSTAESRSESDTENRVKIMLEQYGALFARSMLKQCDKILKKAKKLSIERELFLRLHEILDHERVLARYMLDAGSYEKVVNEVHAEQVRNLEKIRNLTDMNNLGNRVTAFMLKYPTSLARDENIMKEMNAIMDDPLLEDYSKMLSSITRKRFCNMNAVTSQWKNDHEASLKFAKNYLELVEKDVLTKRGALHEYIISLYSVITTATRVANNEEYEKAYEKLNGFNKNFTRAANRDKLEAFYYTGLSVFSKSCDNYRPERGFRMLESAEENLREMDKLLGTGQRIIWYFVIARMCFTFSEFGKAGVWLNRLIAIPNIDLSQDYQCYARIMNLVVAYESGNPDRIEHELRRSYYFLTKRNKIYKYEKIILEYTRQAFRVRSQNEINEMLEFMHRDLSAISNDPFEQNAFDAFNILPWLEKKLQSNAQ